MLCGEGFRVNSRCTRDSFLYSIWCISTWNYKIFSSNKFEKKVCTSLWWHLTFFFVMGVDLSLKSIKYPLFWHGLLFWYLNMCNSAQSTQFWKLQIRRQCIFIKIYILGQNWAWGHFFFFFRFFRNFTGLVPFIVSKFTAVKMITCIRPTCSRNLSILSQVVLL